MLAWDSSEVVVKALNHIFQVLVKKDLTWFIPEWAVGGRAHLKGKRMLEIQLPAVESTPLLRFVSGR